MTVVYSIFVLTHHIYYYININYKLIYRATLENVEKFEKWFYAINQENKIKSLHRLFCCFSLLFIQQQGTVQQHEGERTFLNKEAAELLYTPPMWYICETLRRSDKLLRKQNVLRKQRWEKSGPKKYIQSLISLSYVTPKNC